MTARSEWFLAPYWVCDLVPDGYGYSHGNTVL